MTADLLWGIFAILGAGVVLGLMVIWWFDAQGDIGSDW